MIWRWLGLKKDPYTSEKDIGPYSNYRLAVRLELRQRPGVFAALTSLIAEEGVSIGAVDMVSATRTLVVRGICPSQWVKVSLKETLVAFANGVAVALITAAAVYLWSGSWGLRR